MLLWSEWKPRVAACNTLAAAGWLGNLSWSSHFLPSGDYNGSLRHSGHPWQQSWEVTYKLSAVFSLFEPFCRGHKIATWAESKYLFSVPHFLFSVSVLWFPLYLKLIYLQIPVFSWNNVRVVLHGLYSFTNDSLTSSLLIFIGFYWYLTELSSMSLTEDFTFLSQSFCWLSWMTFAWQLLTFRYSFLWQTWLKPCW